MDMEIGNHGIQLNEVTGCTRTRPSRTETTTRSSPRRTLNSVPTAVTVAVPPEWKGPDGSLATLNNASPPGKRNLPQGRTQENIDPGVAAEYDRGPIGKLDRAVLADGRLDHGRKGATQYLSSWFARLR
jgi:hypothetical protein